MVEEEAEQRERLKQLRVEHTGRVFRKKMLQSAQGVRASLLLWVTFVISVVLLTTAWSVVSVDSAVGFLLGMLATLFVGVLEEEPFEDEIRREGPRHDRIVIFLVGLGFIAWFGLFLRHRVDLAYGVATGFWVGVFSVAWIYQTHRYG